MIELTHKQGPFRAVSWVLKARGNDDARPWIKCMQAKDGWIACTDGARVHRYNMGEGCGWDGLYEIKVCTAKQIILRQVGRDEDVYKEYPDLAGVIAKARVDVLIWEGYPNKEYDAFVYWTITRTTNGFDLEYLKDIHKFAVNEGSMKLYGDMEAEQMFSFIMGGDGQAEAHVMPLRTR